MTTTANDVLQQTSAQPSSKRQTLFVAYFLFVLIDLVALNLFVEYSDYVVIDSFTVSVFCALLLQLLLKLTIALEHWVAAFFKARQGGFAKFMRFFCAWLILFGSKFVILGAIDFVFGHSVDFGGPLGGLVALIVVIITMLVAEAAVVRLHRRLA